MKTVTLVYAPTERSRTWPAGIFTGKLRAGFSAGALLTEQQLANRPPRSQIVQIHRQRVPGFEIQHGHLARPAGDEMQERVVHVLLARDFEYAHARGRQQSLFRTIIVHQQHLGGRRVQDPLLLSGAHVRAQVHALLRETDTLHVAAPGEYARLAQDLHVAVVEFLACARPTAENRKPNRFLCSSRFDYRRATIGFVPLGTLFRDRHGPPNRIVDL